YLVAMSITHLLYHYLNAILPNHIYEITPCTRYARITSTKSLRVRDTPESHLRNRSVYAIRPNHIYEIIPCTRYARITSTKSFRVRDTPESHLRNRSVYARHRPAARTNLRTPATAQKGTRPQLDGCHSHIY